MLLDYLVIVLPILSYILINFTEVQATKATYTVNT